MTDPETYWKEYWRTAARRDIIEAKEIIYGAVADVLWQNQASDVLVARLATALNIADYNNDFHLKDFKERAYGLNTAHP